MSWRHDRFVQTSLPGGSTGPSPELRQLEYQYSHDEAVSLFKKEKKKVKMLKEVCEKAEYYLQIGIVGESLGHLSSLDYHSKVAIVAYTLEEPNIYLHFNEQSRNLNLKNWMNFPYKGMWLLLNKAILSHGGLPCYITVFRGIRGKISLTHSEFCFRQITSTSKESNFAEAFMGTYGTVFILKISRGLDIKPLSLFEKEEEVLLPAFDLFVITKVKDTPNCRKIYLEAKYGPCTFWRRQSSSDSSD